MIDDDIFLPPIRANPLAALAAACEAAGAVSLPLHGDLSLEEQTRAVARGSQRKVVLATNVAESSVTIDGVTAVVDSGLARVSRSSPWSGLSELRVEKISRAAASQRAGRAGRTAPGKVLRLYSRRAPAFDCDGAAQKNSRSRRSRERRGLFALCGSHGHHAQSPGVVIDARND